MPTPLTPHGGPRVINQEKELCPPVRTGHHLNPGAAIQASPLKCDPCFGRKTFLPPLPRLPKMLAVGMGRSYGDVCLLQNGTLLRTPNLDRLIAFDQQTGLLRCEAGVTLAEILDFAVPRGWFLPVSPGTKYVTVGGAIANDIHGKNHHVAGTFGLHTPRFELVRSDGTPVFCSATENPDWYAATIGGMGLTGLISWAEVQLRPIVSRRIRYRSTKFVGLEEFFALSRASNQEYTVAWIDCVAQGSQVRPRTFLTGGARGHPGTVGPPWRKQSLCCPLTCRPSLSIAPPWGPSTRCITTSNGAKIAPASSITSPSFILSIASCSGTVFTARMACFSSNAFCHGRATRWASSR